MSTQLIIVIGLIYLGRLYFKIVCNNVNEKTKKKYAAADHLANILDTRKLFKNDD